MSRIDASSSTATGRPLSRKQREIRDRESRILDVARELIAAEGFGGLSMDRIAEAIEYSKGTVYQHFASKQDLVLRLSLRGVAHWERLHRQALAFRGRSRERLLAVHLGHDLAARLYPVEYECIYVARSVGFRERLPVEGQAAQEAGLARAFDIAAGVVKEAVREGDLVLPEGLTPASLIYGFWSLHYGQISLESSTLPYARLGIRNQQRSLRRTLQAILDGLRWRPLSDRHDYAQVERRILREVFAAEVAVLRTRGS